MTEELPTLQYQLDMLKVEIEVVNQSIRQMDDISKSFKEWTITVWTAAIGGAVATPTLKPFIFATAVVPILFWLCDSYHHVVQRRFIWRLQQIRDFLNDERLAMSFQKGKLVDFVVMDTAAKRDHSAKKADFTSWQKIMLFRTMSILYIGLICLSLLIWLVLTVGVTAASNH